MLLGCTGDEVLDESTYQRLKAEAINSVRGTVQADILKEDQAQTPASSPQSFPSTMGDVQDHFIRNNVRNFIPYPSADITLPKQEPTPLLSFVHPGQWIHLRRILLESRWTLTVLVQT